MIDELGERYKRWRQGASGTTKRHRRPDKPDNPDVYQQGGRVGTKAGSHCVKRSDSTAGCLEEVKIVLQGVVYCVPYGRAQRVIHCMEKDVTYRLKSSVQAVSMSSECLPEKGKLRKGKCYQSRMSVTDWCCGQWCRMRRRD